MRFTTFRILRNHFLEQFLRSSGVPALQCILSPIEQAIDVLLVGLVLFVAGFGFVPDERILSIEPYEIGLIVGNCAAELAKSFPVAEGYFTLLDDQLPRGGHDTVFDSCIVAVLRVGFLQIAFRW